MQVFSIYFKKSIICLTALLLAGTYCNANQAHPDTNQPVQVTSETDPLFSFAVSADGAWLLYTNSRESFMDLWLKPLLTRANPMRKTTTDFLPRRLTSDPSEESSPVFAPDGKQIAFVGRGNDVKGDIYLLDLEDQTAKPRRLTGSESEDEAPCFAADGSTLYFHRLAPQERLRRIFAIDLTQTEKAPAPVLEGDGAFPSISPDGQKMAFISFRADASGDVFLYDFKTRALTQLTKGQSIDSTPSWSSDGQSIYFTRYAHDTNRDDVLDTRDIPSIYRQKISLPFSAYPVTSLNYRARVPRLAQTKLFFLTDRGGIDNCWQLPLAGEIPLKKTPADQIALAEKLEVKIPYQPNLVLLAYDRVLEEFPQDERFSAKAGLNSGLILKQKGLFKAALNRFHHTRQTYPNVQPEADLAQIEALGIILRDQIRTEQDADSRERVLEDGAARLGAIKNSAHPLVQITARLEQARLLFDYSTGQLNRPVFQSRLDQLQQAIEILDTLHQEADQPEYQTLPQIRDKAAEALVLKADIYSRLGQPDRVYPLYLNVIESYADIRVWSDLAVERILNIYVTQAENKTFAEKIRILRNIAEENQKKNPALAIGALARIGDLYYAENEWPKAKAAYYQAIFASTRMTTQTAAARLSLAEILYKEERFREALDLYETEIETRTIEDRIYHLARAGYIQKSIAAAEYLYRLMEIPSAQNRFKSLIDYDPSIVEAHRGYIKCAAALQQTEAVLDRYNARLAEHPGDPVYLYAKALCLTYLNTESDLRKAKDLLNIAIQLEGQIEYFHQTLGYVDEVLETVYLQKGNMEKALESYQKAYFLNDHENNKLNAANLLLNIGNAYFYLNRYQKAFHYYSLRQATEEPFDQIRTEIIFMKRLGACAFQVRDEKVAIDAYTRTLDLITREMAPQKATQIMDKIHRYIMDRIVAVGIRRPSHAKATPKIAARQAAIFKELSLLAPDHFPPPSEEWKIYKKGIQRLLSVQEDLIDDVYDLIEDLNQTPPRKTADANQITPPSLKEARSILSARLIQVQKAIGFPETLVELKTEILDRLGLTQQEAEKYDEAMISFQKAFELNQAMGADKNLARNKRQIAYNKYMHAETLTGQKRMTLLREAAMDFNRVLELLDRYGVPARKAKESSGLLQVNQQVTLDKTKGSQATHGFSKEQEKRLAQAFLSRIHIELGEYAPAQKELTAQLAHYPPGMNIADEDAYGVSLLYHRAGQLAHSNQDLYSGFDDFHQSARLSLRMQNPASTALNTANMANMLAQIVNAPPSQSMPPETFIRQLDQIDKETTALLKTLDTANLAFITAQYHNTLGVHWAHIAEGAFRHSPQTPTDDVTQAFRLQRAVNHFEKGLTVLTKDRALKSRKEMALLATLHLNYANVAAIFAGPHTGIPHLEKALTTSEKALLPDIKWRALAGLGRLKEALTVLKTLPLLNAGCAPFEIQSAFEPLITETLDKGLVEEAFNLTALLTEHERYHRTAFVLADMTAAEKKFYRQVYPRFYRIFELRERLGTAKGDEKDYIAQSLARERKLVQASMGPADENLPAKIRFIADASLKEHIIILLGLSVHAEELAERIAQTEQPEQRKALMRSYNDLLEDYQFIRRTRLANEKTVVSTGLLTFFGPDKVEGVDVMDQLMALSESSRLITYYPLFKKPPQTSSPPLPQFIVFTVTPDEITASYQSGNDLPPNLAPNPPRETYIATETPTLFPPDYSFTLSPAHFIRSIVNRKPFKRTLLCLPSAEKLLSEETFKGYDREIMSDQGDKAIATLTAGTHTLLFTAPVKRFQTVPTQSGERPLTFIGVQQDHRAQLPLTDLLLNAANLSLALLTDLPATDFFVLGHLFSIFNCPTVLLPVSAGNGSTAPFIAPFLKAYQDHPIDMARKMALAQIKDQGSTLRWYQLGFAGMTQSEAGQFARNHFRAFIQKGIQAYQNKQYQDALPYFENTLALSEESPNFGKYRSKLLQYARECAYQNGQMEKAVKFAKTLADLVAKENPDTEQHGEALLRLGLIYSKQERYDTAVDPLMEAVDIFANLELSGKEVSALSDLGIVLEYATDYDRALSFFKTAATKSASLDKQALMAQQYENIGRIQDLRLSRYAAAIAQYQKAYGIYRTLNLPQKMGQVLLDMGRCFRLLGSFDKADKHYDQALALLDKIDIEEDNILLRAKIIIEKANNDWFQARYQDAFMRQREVYRLAREQRLPLMQIIAQNTSGLIWWTLGDTDKALIELQTALSLARDLSTRKDEIATSLNNIGLIYRAQGRYPEALKAFDEALVIDQSLKSRWALAYDLRNKGLTYLKMGREKEAIPLFQKAYEEANAIGNRINSAKALLGLGEARYKTGNNKAAVGDFEKALALSRTMRTRETEWRALYGLAKIELPTDRKKAESLLFEALKVIEAIRAEIKIDRLKDSFIDDKLAVYETLVQLLADEGRIQDAFEIAERSRARNFIDLLGNQKLSLNRVIDQELYDRQLVLRGRIKEQEALSAQASDPEEKASYEKALKELNVAFDNLMLDIQARNPQLAAIVSIDPMPVAKLLPLLTEETMLLSYYILPQEVFCFRLHRSGIKLYRVPIGKQTLSQTIFDYRRRIQNLDPLDNVSQDLYKWLLASVMPDLIVANVSVLGIIPHGALHYLSFATLLLEENQYLIDEFALFYLPSTSIYPYTIGKRTPQKNLSLLAIGNPALGNSSLDLPFAEQEVNAIKWNFSDYTIMTRKKANEKWVTENIGRFGIIHIASHGEFDPVNPLFSAIKLAKSADKDGDLETSEIFGLNIKADMVVLSACQTGLGKITQGDDVIGLNRAFFYAGTHTVISSLWRVSDISTAILTKHFYRHYANSNKAQSLQLAMQDVKRFYPHPGYWGAFTLVGDYY